MGRASGYSLVLASHGTDRAGLLNIHVIFQPQIRRNIRRIARCCIEGMLFLDDFHTLLDHGYGFDDIYSFYLLPSLGTAPLPNRRLYVSDSSANKKAPGRATRSTRMPLVIVDHLHKEELVPQITQVLTKLLSETPPVQETQHGHQLGLHDISTLVHRLEGNESFNVVVGRFSIRFDSGRSGRSSSPPTFETAAASSFSESKFRVPSLSLPLGSRRTSSSQPSSIHRFSLYPGKRHGV